MELSKETKAQLLAACSLDELKGAIKAKTPKGPHDPPVPSVRCMQMCAMERYSEHTHMNDCAVTITYRSESMWLCRSEIVALSEFLNECVERYHLKENATVGYTRGGE